MSEMKDEIIEEVVNTTDSTNQTIDEVTPVEQSDNQAVYTQEQVNSIVAKESGKTLEKALRELGFEGKGRGKEQLLQFRQSLEAQRLAFEQLKADKGELASELERERQVAFDIRLNFALMGEGVAREQLEVAKNIAMALVNAGADYTEAAIEVAQKYPHLCRTKRDIPQFSTSVKGVGEDLSKIKNIFKN